MSAPTPQPIDPIVERVHERFIAESSQIGARSDGTADPRGVGTEDPAVVEARVRVIVGDEAPLLDLQARTEVCDRVLARIVGLGPLEPLLGDAAVTDIMVCRGEVWIDRGGPLERTPLQLDDRTTLHLVERVLAPLGRHVDRSHPVVDARLADGSRVHAVVRPIAVDGPCLTIRRFGARRITLEELGTPGVVSLLRWSVEARSNVVVSGGAGAGKTTLLNALAAHVPSGERVITIEDAAELRLPGEHVVRLEARPATAEGLGAVSIRDLVRAALRMRPDRIIVGEVRSGEALDMLQAMNTGHEGSLSTCHANGAGDALRRLETMVLMGDVDLPLAAVRVQLASAVDLIVHLGRGAAGTRRIAAVAEVEPMLVGGSLSTRLLAGPQGVVALPSRPARAAVAPALDPGWVDT
jgi:pilus assembly protein CpaF